MKRRQSMLLALIVAVTHPLQAAEEVAGYLTQDWYVTELIIFQRPGVMEFNTTERLLITQPKALPWGMRSYFTDTEQIGAGYVLDAATTATLEPNFTTRRAPESFAVPGRDAALQLPRKPPARSRKPSGVPPPAITPALEANALLDFLAAVDEFEDSLNGASYRWEPEAEHVLRRSSALLTRRFGSRVLLHGRWLQPVPPRDAAQPLYIQAGPRFSDTHLLEGTLSITLGRYLHFRAQLVYREPGLGHAPVSLPYPVGAEATPLPALPAVVPGYMVLDESRRMRSEEVHYLDHPKLGIIVRVDPVTIPEELQLRFQALQESAE